MQARNVCLCAGALAILLGTTASAQEPPPAQPAPEAEPAPSAQPAPESKPPADISRAVDENGVPAWAKRKRMRPVQNCESKPGINSATWRERVDTSGVVERRKIRPPQATCR